MSEGKNKASRPMRGGSGRHGSHGGGPGEKAKDFSGSLKRLIRYLQPHIPALIFVIVVSALSTLFSIVSPRVMGMVTTSLYDSVSTALHGGELKIDFTLIGKVLVILGLLYAASSAFSYFQQYTMAGISQKLVRRMRGEVDKKLGRLPLSYFDHNSTGDIMSRISNDVDNISMTLQQSFTQMITAVITLVGVLVMMLQISPLLTLVCLLTLPLCALVAMKVVKRSQKYYSSMWRVTGELNGHIEEMYTGHNIVRAFNYEDASLDEFKQHNEKLYEVSWKAQFISGITQPLLSVINNLGYVAICVFGGVRVASGNMTLGDVQAFMQYSRQFTQPINQAANIMNTLQSTVASAEHVFELLDEKEEIPDAPDAYALTDPHGHVDFEHVAFSYVPEKPLIQDMSIDVEPGQTVAIVGPTGAGKTTIVNLLMRFYEINAGTIAIDGHDILSITRGSLRKSFGMVLQDTWVFTGTIRENIAYGREGATDAEIVSAAKAARIDRFIHTLPNGYDTILSGEASSVSQGQMQLLTIARAILADPEILILDEATSSVDTRTEVLIQRAMNELMKGRTSFVIAHRLSTIRDANLILVMNAGDIVEQGTHTELLAQNGFYADLYNSQFG